MKKFCGCNSGWDIRMLGDDPHNNAHQLCGDQLFSGSLGMCPGCHLYRWYNAYHENEMFDLRNMNRC